MSDAEVDLLVLATLVACLGAAVVLAWLVLQGAMGSVPGRAVSVLAALVLVLCVATIGWLMWWRIAGCAGKEVTPWPSC